MTVPARVVAVVLLVGGVCAVAQTSLPATRPTATQAAPAAMSVGATVGAMHPAVVTFTAGQLEIAADNSSLNQILLEIGRQTGMKITGGVQEQRVYGTYGPAQAAVVLTSLLDGTGTNMLLRENAAKTPVELILTPRNGGMMPPGPNTVAGSASAPPPAGWMVVQRPGEAPRDLSVPGGDAPVGGVPIDSNRPPLARSSNGETPGLTNAYTGSRGDGTGTNPPSPNGVPTPTQVNQQRQQFQRTPP